MPSRPDDRITLRAGGVELVIDLRMGARAVSWTVDGEELLGGAGVEAVEYGMYPMAPWAGRVRGNAVEHDGTLHALPVTYHEWALHGTVLSRAADVVRHVQDADEARLVARVAEHPGWPWPTEVDIEWRVQPDRVTTVLTVRALTDPFPAVVGWHPWFRRRLSRGGALEWSLDATSRLLRGPDHLPTGDHVPYVPTDGPFDDAFRAATATVEWPGALTIDIVGGAGWFVVFDERPDCVCVEPQSGPPDGLNSGYGEPVRIATPELPLALTSTWVIRRATPADPA